MVNGLKNIILCVFVSFNLSAADDISRWDGKLELDYKVKSVPKSERDKIIKLSLEEFKKWVERELVLTKFKTDEVKWENRLDFPYSPEHIVELFIERMANEYVVDKALYKRVDDLYCSYYSFIYRWYEGSFLERFDREHHTAHFQNCQEDGLKTYVLTDSGWFSKHYFTIFKTIPKKLIRNDFSRYKTTLKKPDKKKELYFRLPQNYPDIADFNILGYGAIPLNQLEKDYNLIKKYYPEICRADYFERYASNSIDDFSVERRSDGMVQVNLGRIAADHNYAALNALGNFMDESFAQTETIKALSYLSWLHQTTFKYFLYYSSPRKEKIRKNRFEFYRTENYPYRDYFRRYFNMTKESENSE